MCRIMLIDDDEAPNFYHRELLIEAGFSSDHIHDFLTADDALHFLRDVHQQQKRDLWPDVILLDINMPLKSGFQFMEEYVDCHFSFDKPRIIIVSSSTSPLDMAKAAEVDEIDGYEVKYIQLDFFERLKEEFSSKEVQE